MLGMIGKFNMRGKHLERIFPDQFFGIVAFPARDIARHGRSLFIIGIKPLQALGDKLDLAAVGCQQVGFRGIQVGIQRVRSIAGPAFVEPAVGYGKLVDPPARGTTK